MLFRTKMPKPKPGAVTAAAVASAATSANHALSGVALEGLPSLWSRVENHVWRDHPAVSQDRYVDYKEWLLPTVLGTKDSMVYDGTRALTVRSLLPQRCVEGRVLQQKKLSNTTNSTLDP